MDAKQVFLEKDVPYYIPCLYPLVHEYLKNNNINSFLSLHTNIELLGLPALSINDGRTEFKICTHAHNARRLGYKSRFDYLGFNVFRREYKGEKEEIMTFLKSMMAQHGAMIVGGSSYFLPYCSNYLNADYIEHYPNPLFGVVNHWVGLYGIGEEELLVRDTTFNYFGPVKISDFLNFWNGDKQIERLRSFPGVSVLLEKGYIDVTVNRTISKEEYEELFLRTLRTLTYEYLRGHTVKEEGHTYYFGKSAVGELVSSLNQAASEGMDKAILEAINLSLINLRFNRFIFRDFLLEMGQVCETQYDEFYNQFKSIVEKLENISYMFSIYLKRNRSNLDSIKNMANMLNGYWQEETMLFERLQPLTEKVRILDRNCEERG